MKLVRLRIKGFQSFGQAPATLSMDAMSFFLGPNGAGKTAVLSALARMFALDPALRHVRASDFHTAAIVDAGDEPELEPEPEPLWIEAQFEFPELLDDDGTYSTIPGNFAHMALETADGVPRIRVRLTAEIDEDGEIEESLVFVTESDEADEPVKTAQMAKHDRASIQVHYLPARRDPGSHISYAASSLLGRVLRSMTWTEQKAAIAGLTKQISDVLADHPAVTGLGAQLGTSWGELHTGSHFANPTVSFERNEIEGLLRHLTIGFGPGHGEPKVDFTRLSDGQQSLLYVSLVLSVQAIGRQVLAGELEGFDVDKLRPPVFSLIAMEEPENSLSPHLLGRVLRELQAFSEHHDAQVAVATHSPALLRRVPPEQVRYLRLDPSRCTVVSTIQMPDASDEAYKFVREAVCAYPELYFSRLIILGEGDSEEVVLPRLMAAHGMVADQASISVVPLGGRHVNHFWRLLSGLAIPYVTLLDLDLGRNHAGWGRIRYAAKQLLAFPAIDSNLSTEQIDAIPAWDDPSDPRAAEAGQKWITFLESSGVFFSTPLDLDYSMLLNFPGAFEVEAAELEPPDSGTLRAVLGKSSGWVGAYDAAEQSYFGPYASRFRSKSKPAAHLAALSVLNDTELGTGTPESLGRLLEAVAARLADLPE
jgi:putative ATP-dependent endonuclease of OLD family